MMITDLTTVSADIFLFFVRLRSMTAPGLQAFAILLLCLAPLAPANEGVAQLTPSARGLQATGETRAASHLRLAAANPWAKPGHDGPAVVVRTIGSRPTNEDVGVARLNVTQPAHDDLAKQNPWAKPLSTTLASHSRATVDCRTDSASRTQLGPPEPFGGSAVAISSGPGDTARPRSGRSRAVDAERHHARLQVH